MNLEDKRTTRLAVLRVFRGQPLGRVCAVVARPGGKNAYLNRNGQCQVYAKDKKSVELA